MMKHYCAIFLIVTLGVRNCVGGCSDEVEYHSERCDIFNRFRAVTDRVINLEEAKWKHEEKINALTISLGQKENQINELNNKDELKDKTIQLLYKQVEKLTISLDEKEEQINKLIFNDELKNDTIQLLTTLVDELQRRNAPRSCSVLKKQGIVRDQETYLDFDGQNFGRPPFLGKCLFASGETSLGMETTINITRCGDQAKCFQQDILLDEELLTEIDNAINHFPTCSQDWEFRSSSALLNDPVNHEPLLFWKDRMGNTTNFLEAEDHDTINGEKRFRGSVTQTTKLPITGVIYDGPLSSGLAQITIKSVKCLSETNEVPPLEERFHQSVKTTNEKINKINTDIEEAKSELKNDFEMELNDTKTDLQSKIKTKASKAELQIKMETKVSTSAYESKISSLEASVRTKVSTSTYNPKITALESLIGTKISTSSYNRKISSLESSIDNISNLASKVDNNEQDIEDINEEIVDIKEDVGENVNDIAENSAQIALLNKTIIVDCTWSDWSDCSATCGPGVKSRTIAEEAMFGGKPCDGLNQTPCTLQDCPSVNCTWSDWSDCSATFGSGVKSRTIAEEAMFGGKPCNGLNQTPCNLQDCETCSSRGISN